MQREQQVANACINSDSESFFPSPSESQTRSRVMESVTESKNIYGKKSSLRWISRSITLAGLQLAKSRYNYSCARRSPRRARMRSTLVSPAPAQQRTLYWSLAILVFS